MEVSGHYSKHLTALKALVNAGAARFVDRRYSLFHVEIPAQGPTIDDPWRAEADNVGLGQRRI